MSDNMQGQLYQKMRAAQPFHIDHKLNLVYPDDMVKILDAARAEIPTRADAEKVAKERFAKVGGLGHSAFDVGFIACIHAELFGKWADKWFGKPLKQ